MPPDSFTVGLWPQSVKQAAQALPLRPAQTAQTVGQTF